MCSYLLNIWCGLTLKQGKRAVHQLHDDAIQHLHHGGNVQQHQNDWLKKNPRKKRSQNHLTEKTPQKLKLSKRGQKSYLIFAKYISLSNRVEKRVSNLPSSSCD